MDSLIVKLRIPTKRKRSEQDDPANTAKRRYNDSSINACSGSVNNSSHDNATTDNGSGSGPDMDSTNSSVKSDSTADPNVKDIAIKDAALDVARVSKGKTLPQAATDVAPSIGPLSHPAIWKSYQYFRQAFPHGPEIFYHPFTHHNLGGFRAIIQSMAAQHPGLRRPTLREFAKVVCAFTRPRNSAERKTPLPYMYEALSASKVDGHNKWEPDCFNDDTHFVLQDHLAALLGIWGSNSNINLNLTLAIWTNGVPWAYKVWDRHDVQSTKVVWIYHDGNHSYAGLGPLGSSIDPSIKAMTTNDFSDQELEDYERMVDGFGSCTAQHSSNRPAEQPTPVAQPRTVKQPIPTTQSTLVEQSASAEQPVTDEDPAHVAESTTAEPSAPVGQSPIVKQSATAAQSTPAEESVTEELITAEEPAPAAQSTTVEQPTPGIQSTAAEPSAPNTQPPIVEQSATAAHSTTPEQLVTAEEPVSAENTFPSEYSMAAAFRTPLMYPAAELPTPSTSPLSK